MNQETKVMERVNIFIKNNLLKLLMILLIIIYIAKGCFEFVRKEFDWAVFIGDMALSISTGGLFYFVMRINGLHDGKKDPIYIASYNLYAETKVRVSSTKQYKLSPFCIYKNEVSLEERKASYMSEFGLDYNLYKNGLYSEGSKMYAYLEEDQIECIKSVNKVKIFRLTPKYLMSDSPTSKKKNSYMDGDSGIKDTKSYLTEGIVTDIASMLLFSFVFSFYVLQPLINGDTLANVIWNIFQVLIWLTFGMMKYFSSKDFILNEYRQTHLVDKTETLCEFLSIMQHDESLLDPYDYLSQAIKKQEEDKTNVNNQEI